MSRRRSDVELVRAELTHNQFLYELYAKPEILRGVGLRLPIPAVDWRRMIQRVLDGWQDVWVVREGLLNVGYAGLQDRSDEDRRAEVSIAVEPSRQNRGTGREALRQVIEMAHGRFELDLLIARVRADNPRALHLFSSFGFEESGWIGGYYHDGGGHVVTQVIMTHRSGSARTGDFSEEQKARMRERQRLSMVERAPIVKKIHKVATTKAARKPPAKVVRRPIGKRKIVGKSKKRGRR